MAGLKATKKRSHQDSAAKSKSQRPTKKQKKILAYHSDSDEEEPNPEFKPVNLQDSDEEDLDNAVVDDGASSSDSGADTDDSSESEREEPDAHQKLKKRKATAEKSPGKEQEDSSEGDDEEEDDDDDADSISDTASTMKNTKSKRNDPTAFATSLSKILSTKLSTSRRADPVLSRSADAIKASKEAVDSALELKARKQLRLQKLQALEKGRVRDVLVATRNDVTGELEASTAEILEQERRLRKVAQRGVVKLFNAVRAAQVRGAEAEKQARKDGFVGVKSREEKVTEMSRKGFLDLIASGGGGLKKGALEEA